MGDAQQSPPESKHSWRATFAGIIMLIALAPFLLRIFLDQESGFVLSLVGVTLGVFLLILFLGKGIVTKLVTGVVFLVSLFFLFGPVRDYYSDFPQLIPIIFSALIFVTYFFGAKKEDKIIQTARGLKKSRGKMTWFLAILFLFTVAASFFNWPSYLNMGALYYTSFVVNVLVLIYIYVSISKLDIRITGLGGKEKRTAIEEVELKKLVFGKKVLFYFMIIPIASFVVSFFVGTIGGAVLSAIEELASERNQIVFASLYLLVGYLLWTDHTRKGYGIIGLDTTGKFWKILSRILELTLILLGALFASNVFFGTAVGDVDQVGVQLMSFLVYFALFMIITNKLKWLKNSALERDAAGNVKGLQIKASFALLFKTLLFVVIGLALTPLAGILSTMVVGEGLVTGFFTNLYETENLAYYVALGFFAIITYLGGYFRCQKKLKLVV
jgi:hypothetical protein